MTDETRPIAAADPYVGRVFDGRYQVARKIGTGGMANVYLATDSTLGRDVAIKVLNPNYAADGQFVERFMREASSAARLNHPNIVQVYDRGQTQGTFYISMEYVEGRSLKALIRDSGPLSEARTLDFARQALNALRFAHRNGIVHRDIKPHNMLVDAEGRLKIADFGIARAGADHGLTEVGSIVGTAQYLSPEQARGEVVAASSDLYSLGVVLFEMATGRVPFDGDQPVNVALKHVNEPVPHPRFLNSSITPQLEAVILRAMEKNPDMRYQTADAFLADLDAVEGGTRVQAAVAQAPVMEEEPEETKRKLWPWALLAVALGITALIAFLALSSGERVEVPDVAGSTLSEARVTIEDAGLQVGEVETEFSDEEAKGTVLDTDPSAGAKVEKDSRVDVIVSGGDAPVEVPDFIGSTVPEAQADAKEAGLTLRVREVASTDVEKGTIGAQNPAPGEEVAAGDTVTVNVSTGAGAITVPAVTGTAVESAKAKLEAAGFSVRVRETDSAEAAGQVTAQSPAAGTDAKEGDTITLTAASGFNSVPALIDQSEDEATDAIAAAGFRVRIVEETAQDPSLPIDGKVTSQTPDGGGRLEVGSEVRITITRPEQDTGTTPTDAPTTEEPAPTDL